jgi:hypothetical protein
MQALLMHAHSAAYQQNNTQIFEYAFGAIIGSHKGLHELKPQLTKDATELEHH